MNDSAMTPVPLAEAHPEKTMPAAKSHEQFLSVILPVHNQADHIGGIVSDYCEALTRTRLAYEIILVTNACRDRSPEVCTGLADQFPNVRTVDTKKGGWGLAVKLGLKEARGNILCYTNSARTTAADLQLLVLYAVANPEAVVKSHRISREAFRRKIGSLLYNMECRWLFKLPTWDINATPKVFSRETYEAINPQSDGDLIDLEVFVKCKQLGKIVLEVPIYSLLRHGGRSTTNYRSAARMYFGAYQLWCDMKKGTDAFVNFTSP